MGLRPRVYRIEAKSKIKKVLLLHRETVEICFTLLPVTRVAPLQSPILPEEKKYLPHSIKML
jgi:hypothetical protein